MSPGLRLVGQSRPIVPVTPLARPGTLAGAPASASTGRDAPREAPASADASRPAPVLTVVGGQRARAVRRDRRMAARAERSGKPDFRAQH
jgi:hypothetical protein